MEALAARAQHAEDEDWLAGRVALVTGGTRGIGAAISSRLALRGAAVAAGYSSDRARAEELRKSIEKSGAGASVHRGNVGDPDDCRRVVGEVIEQHGRLDILVNNAGVTADRPILSMTVEDWHKVLRVNLSGAFYMSKPALEHMIERGSGRIINISSITGEIGNIGQANYAASKSGLFGFTKTLAREAAFALAKADRLSADGIGLDGQRGDAGADRDRDDGGRAREGDRVVQVGDPDAPLGPPRGDRPRGGLPRRGRLGLYHRPGLGRQRRPRYVRRFRRSGGALRDEPVDAQALALGGRRRR